MPPATGASGCCTRSSHDGACIYLTEEPTETLYALGKQAHRGHSHSFTVRPPQARREKRRVSAFTSAKVEEILEQAGSGDRFLRHPGRRRRRVDTAWRGSVDCPTTTWPACPRLIIRRLALWWAWLHAPVPMPTNCNAGWTPSPRRRRGCRGGRASMWRSGTNRSSPASSGVRNWWRSPAASTCSRSCRANRWRRPHPRLRRPGGRAQPGHHHRLMVRQEVPPRAGGGKAGLGGDQRSARWRAARNQVADHPATPPGGLDRWRAGHRTDRQSMVPTCRGGVSGEAGNAGKAVKTAKAYPSPSPPLGLWPRGGGTNKLTPSVPTRYSAHAAGSRCPAPVVPTHAPASR